MKVIQKGTPRNWSTQVRCDGKGQKPEKVGCGALLEIDANDVFTGTKTEGDQRETYNVTIHLIQCPECSFYTEVKNIPAYVRQFIFRTAPQSTTNAYWDDK